MALRSKSSHVTLDDTIELVQVLHYMHWDYDQYLAQPQWLLDAVRTKMEEDSLHQRKENKAT